MANAHAFKLGAEYVMTVMVHGLYVQVIIFSHPPKEWSEPMYKSSFKKLSLEDARGDQTISTQKLCATHFSFGDVPESERFNRSEPEQSKKSRTPVSPPPSSSPPDLKKQLQRTHIKAGDSYVLISPIVIIRRNLADIYHTTSGDSFGAVKASSPPPPLVKPALWASHFELGYEKDVKPVSMRDDFKPHRLPESPARCDKQALYRSTVFKSSNREKQEYSEMKSAYQDQFDGSSAVRAKAEARAEVTVRGT